MNAFDFSRIKALTFDCYGTLIDWERGILAVLRPWAARHGLKVTDDDLLGAYALAEHPCQQASPHALYPEILRAVHQRIAAHFNAAPSSTDAAALAKSIPTWPPFEDTPQALVELKKRFKLLILSNIDRASFAQSNRMLGVEFDAIITAEDVGSYKPAPGHFLRALERLEAVGISRDETAHVAESLFHDHVPAQALGIKSIWINRRHGKTGSGATPPAPANVKPDLALTNLAQLAEQTTRPLG